MARPALCQLLLLLGACTTGLNSGCGPQGKEPPPRPVQALQPVAAPEQLGQVAFAHVERLVAMGPRHVGKPGHGAQLDYICQQLEAAGLQPERDTWTDDKEQVAFTNVSATIAGELPQRIVIGCHHDTKCTEGHRDEAHNFAFVGANDGGSGVGLLLALAPVLRQQKPKATIQLLFLDGEESLDWDWNDGARALFGSRRFVRRYRDARILGEQDRIAAFVLLDLVGRKDLHIQEESKSTPELLDLVWSAAVATGHQQHFFRKRAAASDDHVPFLDAGVPAVDLIDLEDNPHWHQPTDTLANMSPRSLQIVGEVVLTMLPAIERLYLPARQVIR